MPAQHRPLSPHLQIYKLPLLAVLSISHRLTGAAMFLAALLFVYWLAALAGGAEAFATAQALFSNLLVQLLLFLASFGLFYHLCNGVRHLFWDAGYGFELGTAERSGVAVLMATAALTAALWTVAALWGGA
jgi:succinate dehydrogenase / fumarate reductase cytochrome b subunit